MEEIFKEEYGNLALSRDNIPYSVPISFVFKDGIFYFHGSKKGKKHDLLKANSYASFSIVQPFSLIQSYFSQNEENGCATSQFFRSVIADGEIVIVEKREEKISALTELMKKYQPEGKYRPFRDESYEKMIDVTEIFKLVPKTLKGKMKFGQHLPKERFELIIRHLKERGNDIDLLTIEEMKRAGLKG